MASSPHLIRRLALCAMLGLGTSVAVAWGLAFRLPATVQSTKHYSIQDNGLAVNFFVVDEIHDLGLQRRGIHYEQIIAFPMSHPIAFWQSRTPRQTDFGVASHTIEPWGVLREIARRGKPDTTLAALRTDDARGWPALALWCAQGLRRGGGGNQSLIEPYIHGGLRIGSPPVGDAAVMADSAWFRAIPFLPIWSGLAINTVFYAVLWFLLWFAFVARRSARRGRRGSCARCGYDLRGDFAAGCPECGWGRSAATAA